jgi:hypothetical protein
MALALDDDYVLFLTSTNVVHFEKSHLFATETIYHLSM